MHICDWTHWQGEPAPAAQIEKEGFGAVKMKAGGATKEGPLYIDPVFVESARRVQATSLAPFAYWYLVPGKPIAQAGLFCDLIREANKKYPGHLNGWVLELDVEQAGLTSTDVSNFLLAWNAITDRYPLIIYTNKSLWIRCTADLFGAGYTPHLEEAHWVNQSVRDNPATKYASQQVKAVEPHWWEVDYGGWSKAVILQFTNKATVASKQVPCSFYNGDKGSFLAQLAA